MTLPLVAGGCGSGSKANFQRKVLDNGVTVIVHEVEGVDHVAMKVLYRTGFMHDMKGVPQTAHLAEHLLTSSATANFKAGEAMELIVTRGGSTRAETLAEFTHFTYVVSAVDVNLVLRLEVDRIKSLLYNAELAEFERQRCYDELHREEAVPSAPVLSFYATAANQHWRYGAEKVAIASGLESLSAEETLAFIRGRYVPERLIIVISGGVKPDVTIDFVEAQLGGLPRTPVAEIPAIDWDALPEHAEVQWDSPVNAVLLWFKPPQSETDRIALSLWGDSFAANLAADGRIREVSRFMSTTRYTWPIADMPFFVYATVREDVSLETASEVLKERVGAILAEVAGTATPDAVHDKAKNFSELELLDLQTILQQALFLKHEHKYSSEEAVEFTLTRHSLHLGLREMLFGDPLAGRLPEAMTLSESDFQGAVTRLAESPNRGVTLLRGTGGE